MNNPTSLNKAANFLGCCELANFDYKSLNSIRKLSKTLGCMEYDLMKNLRPIQSEFEQNVIKLDITDNLSTNLLDGVEKNDKILYDDINTDNKETSFSDMTFIKSSRKMFQRSKILKRYPIRNKRDKIEDKTHLILNSDQKVTQKQNNIHENNSDSSSAINVFYEPSDSFNKSMTRYVSIERDDNLGFGFIAGSEKPLVIRFVSSNGPAHKKLLNGDEILFINGENVQYESRSYVINLIKTSPDKIELIVKQPTPLNEKSVLLTEQKKAFKKVNHQNNKVRFNLACEESDSNSEQNIKIRKKANKKLVKRNSIKKFLKGNNNAASISNISKVSQFDSSSSTSEYDSNPVERDKNINVIKVYLENNLDFKFFKFGTHTSVNQILICLKEMLGIKNLNYYGLCIRANNHIATEAHSKLFFLYENRLIGEILKSFENFKPIEFTFRIIFVPSDVETFFNEDIDSFTYLYQQCLNDKINFCGGIQHDKALKLAALSMVNEYFLDQFSKTYSSSYYKKYNKKFNIELKNFDLENFIPKSVLSSVTFKKKDFKKHLNQTLELVCDKKMSKNDIKLEYIKLLETEETKTIDNYVFNVIFMNHNLDGLLTINRNGLSFYDGKWFKEIVNLTLFQYIDEIYVSRYTKNMVKIDLVKVYNEKEILNLAFFDDEYLEFLYLLQGYLRVLVYPTKHYLCPINKIETKEFGSLNVAQFLVMHPNPQTEYQNEGDVQKNENAFLLSERFESMNINENALNACLEPINNFNENIKHDNPIEPLINKLKNINSTKSRAQYYNNTEKTSYLLDKPFNTELVEKISHCVSIINPISSVRHEQFNKDNLLSKFKHHFDFEESNYENKNNLEIDFSDFQNDKAIINYDHLQNVVTHDKKLNCLMQGLFIDENFYNRKSDSEFNLLKAIKTKTSTFKNINKLKPQIHRNYIIPYYNYLANKYSKDSIIVRKRMDDFLALEKHDASNYYDVIDLTRLPFHSIFNEILVAPPPLEFSDLFQKSRDLQLNEVELESGIESDSTSDGQVVDTKNARFSSELVINLMESSTYDENSIQHKVYPEENSNIVFETKIETFVKSYPDEIQDSSYTPEKNNEIGPKLGDHNEALTNDKIVNKSNDSKNIDESMRLITPIRKKDSELKKIKTPNVKTIAKLFERNQVASRYEKSTEKRNSFQTNKINSKHIYYYSRHLKESDNINSKYVQLPKTNFDDNITIEENTLCNDITSMIHGNFISRVDNKIKDCRDDNEGIVNIKLGQLFGVNNNKAALDGGFQDFTLDDNNTILGENIKIVENGIKASKCKLARIDIDSKIKPVIITDYSNDKIFEKEKYTLNYADFEKCSPNDTNSSNIVSLSCTSQRKLMRVTSYSDGENDLMIKGALKKTGTVKERSISRVRWKDMVDTAKKLQNNDSLEENKLNKQHIVDFDTLFNQLQFDSQISNRINEIDKLIGKLKPHLGIWSTEDLYEQIHKILDKILFELNLTIESIRISSAILPENNNFLHDDALQNEINAKKKEMADICRHFVNSSKNMISSSLTNIEDLKIHVIAAMEYLCLLVRGCLEITYLYLHKDQKLDQTRTILTQLLSLINTFRSTSFISFLTVRKQLKNENMPLLMNNATNLANEISALIKNFKALL